MPHCTDDVTAEWLSLATPAGEHSLENWDSCCMVSGVLNLSIDLNSLTLAKSNWHVHKNYSACGSAALNPKPAHVMTALKSIPTLLQGGVTTVVLNFKENKDRACLKLLPNNYPLAQCLFPATFTSSRFASSQYNPPIWRATLTRLPPPPALSLSVSSYILIP